MDKQYYTRVQVKKPGAAGLLYAAPRGAAPQGAGRSSSRTQVAGDGLLLMLCDFPIYFIWALCSIPMFRGANRAFSKCENNAIHALGFCVQRKGDYYV